ncbi:MAG: sugar transferase [Anaerolineae bacterium]|nr:sugar transferase [Anaerolineae bacterium]
MYISRSNAQQSLAQPRRQILSVQLAEHKTILAAVDGILVFMALLLGLWLGAQRSGWVFSFKLVLAYSPWFVGLMALYFVFASANDAYRPRVTSDTVASTIALIKTVLGVFILYLLVYALIPYPYSLPRHFIGFFAVISPFLLLGWRHLYRLAFAMPVFQRKAIIVGAGWAGQTIARTLKDFAPAHFEVVGFVDDDPAKRQQTFENVPVTGTTADLMDLAQTARVTDIILAITQSLQGEVLASLLACYEQGLRVTTMADLYEHLTDRVPVEHIGDNWFVALPLNGQGQNLSYRIIKRGLDICVALLGLVLFALLLPFLALVIRLDSSGPIFYRQKRIGRGGREFKLIKLRSMVVDAEEDGQVRWAEKYDTRVTRAGLFLRRTRLDETPQLVNVLRGEMSLVGPRPERPEFVDKLQNEIPFYRTRLTVKPGLTGWAQVYYDYGRSAKDALEKLRYDLYYIKHQSIQLDLVILLKTISTILLLKGT